MLQNVCEKKLRVCSARVPTQITLTWKDFPTSTISPARSSACNRQACYSNTLGSLEKLPAIHLLDMTDGMLTCT